MGRRHKDIKPAVTQAGFHTVLPALISHSQQFTEDLCIRRHAAAFQLSVHGIPHFGGGIAVGVDPLAAGHGVQLGPQALLLFCQIRRSLPGSKILLFQRLFDAGQRLGQGGKLFRCQALGPELLLHRKAAAVQLGQQAGDGIRSRFQTIPCPGCCIQRALFPGQLLGQGIQRPARAAVTGRSVGR